MSADQNLNEIYRSYMSKRSVMEHFLTQLLRKSIRNAGNHFNTKNSDESQSVSFTL